MEDVIAGLSSLKSRRTITNWARQVMTLNGLSGLYQAWGANTVAARNIHQIRRASARNGTPNLMLMAQGHPTFQSPAIELISRDITGILVRMMAKAMNAPDSKTCDGFLKLLVAQILS